MMTPASILEAAADYMEVHGWTQGVSENSSGEVCVHGAIMRGAGVAITYGDMDLQPLLFEAERIFGKVVRYRRVHEWNDIVCESKYEAIEALRLAAKLAHEENREE
jgi:hypothetical protein